MINDDPESLIMCRRVSTLLRTPVETETIRVSPINTREITIVSFNNLCRIVPDLYCCGGDVTKNNGFGCYTPEGDLLDTRDTDCFKLKHTVPGYLYLLLNFYLSLFGVPNPNGKIRTLWLGLYVYVMFFVCPSIYNFIGRHLGFYGWCISVASKTANK